MLFVKGNEVQKCICGKEAVRAIHTNCCVHCGLNLVGGDEEKDPLEQKSSIPGAKFDSGKPMAAQILGQFSAALTEVAKVGTFGASKYSLGGWKHVRNGFNRYDDAGMRHFLKRKSGEDIDPDSELSHLSHEAWNALAKLQLHLERQ